jgi:ferredoxin
MAWYEYIAWVSGSLFCLLSLAFIITSFREREKRAALLGLVVLVPLCLLWFLILTELQVHRKTVLGGGLAGFAVVVTAFFLPLGKKDSLEISGQLERLDERDIIFSRAKYDAGTEAYQEYYARHPELKSIDDTIRRLPELCKPGSVLYHELESRIPDSNFGVLEDMRGLAEGFASGDTVDVDPAAMSRRLKWLANYYGAVGAGIARLKEDHVYTHVGRGPGVYGERVDLDHSFALVFTVEMDRLLVRQAPRMPVLLESGRQYLRAAMIAIPIASYIRSLGYSARAHTDGNYRIVVPPVAVDAGLGEIGRIGLLMTPNLGPRVRLGAVTTDMPLIPDAPVSFGAIDFCQTCRKCAENCPAGAISYGERKNVRGVRKWQVHQEACYAYWRKIGTDCAMCVSVCPYSKEKNFVHNVVRLATRQSVAARRLSKLADDFFYGRTLRSV